MSASQVQPDNAHRRHKQHTRFTALGILEPLYGSAALLLTLMTIQELEVDPVVIEQLGSSVSCHTCLIR